MRAALVVVAAFAVLAALLAWTRWLAGRRWAAAGHLSLAAVAVAAVASVWPLTAYVTQFELRRDEMPFAELFFEQIGAHRYRATLTGLPWGRMQVVELAGDQWRLDLHTLDWSERIRPLGLAPRYRIERLHSRERPPAAASDSARPVAAHALTEIDAAPPWLAGLEIGRGTPLVVARDLAGPWRPMADGARFDLRLRADSRIVVDPRNAAASDALAAQR